MGQRRGASPKAQPYSGCIDLKKQPRGSRAIRGPQRGKGFCAVPPAFLPSPASRIHHGAAEEPLGSRTVLCAFFSLRAKLVF